MSTMFFSEISYAEEKPIKPENIGRNILAGMTGDGCGKPVTELTDGNLNTKFIFEKFADKGCDLVSYNFSSPIAISGYSYVHVAFSHPSFLFYMQDGTFKKIDGGGSNKIIYLNLKNVVSVGITRPSFGSYAGLAEIELYEYELAKPMDITDLKETVTYKSVKFDYHFPKENFSYVKVLRDGKIIADNVKIENFTDSNVKANTEYTYQFLVVSPEGAFSKGFEKKIKTDEAPNLSKPKQPSIPVTKEEDRTLVVNLPQYDAGVRLQGFNVFVDGKKVNDTVVTSRSFVVGSLTNNHSYDLQIQAVSRWNVVSDLSDHASFKPWKKTIPDVRFTFGLNELIESIKAWFSSLWGIIVFTICIPLAFIIAKNTKHLFLR
ncbi:fibronectin type III domain-containing protein [Bacillus cytotoxicus]|uniref:Fibronectin type III domain-containing protein n=2 Tax=Bacillus cytotoxicus TaxID=580165 RepID=A0ACC6AD91_9BACI|nr:fibronectin type III domain-containing protein [Bacillus cytotoxicus]